MDDKVNGLYDLVCDAAWSGDGALPPAHSMIPLKERYISRVLARWASIVQRSIRHAKLEQRSKAVGHLIGRGDTGSAQLFKASGGSLLGTVAPRLYGAHTHKVPRRRGLTLNSDQQAAWRALGGIDVEPALRGDAIAVIDAQWIITHAARGESLPCRQQIPYHAFLSCDQLIQSCRPSDGPAHGLPLIVVSSAWLQQDHPDPKAHTLRQLATLLRAFLQGHQQGQAAEATAVKVAGTSWRERMWGVVWDWASLHQCPDLKRGLLRTPEEQKLFEVGRAAMGDLYAHPHVWTIINTALPLGYPGGYDLPLGHHTEPYGRRGWPGLEHRLASFIKDWRRVLDLARLQKPPDAPTEGALAVPATPTTKAGRAEASDGSDSEPLPTRLGSRYPSIEAGGAAAVLPSPPTVPVLAKSSSLLELSPLLATRWRVIKKKTALEGLVTTMSLTEAIEQCSLPSARLVPLTPQSFATDLTLRSFANDEDDETLVNDLYAAQFKRVLGTASVLDLSHLQWTDAEAETVADVLMTGELKSLEWLLLNDNTIGTRGALAIVRALEKCPNIKFVRLDDNAINDTIKVANVVLHSVHLGKLGMRLELGDNLPCLPFPWEKNRAPITVRLDSVEDQ